MFDFQLFFCHLAFLSLFHLLQIFFSFSLLGIFFAKLNWQQTIKRMRTKADLKESQPPFEMFFSWMRSPVMPVATPVQATAGEEGAKMMSTLSISCMVGVSLPGCRRC